MAFGDSAFATAPTSVASPDSYIDLGKSVERVESCPLKDYERLVLAAGESHLSLIALYKQSQQDDALKEVPGLEGKLEHQGAVHAVAWGSNKVPVVAAVGTGTLSLHEMHAGGFTSCSLTLPSSDRVHSCCFIGGESQRVAVTGDGEACHILALPDGGVERTLTLRSAGVAVRTHEREPHQLMVAEDEGHVHFVDLRVPTARPSLTRSLPPSFGVFDAGGLRVRAHWILKRCHSERMGPR